MEREVLEAMRSMAKESGRALSSILTDAAKEYLERARVRPTFLASTEDVLDAHDELLTRLAR